MNIPVPDGNAQDQGLQCCSVLQYGIQIDGPLIVVGLGLSSNLFYLMFTC